MRRFTIGLVVAFAWSLIVLPACVPQPPAPNVPIGGGGGTLTPPAGSNSNRNSNRNANVNRNSNSNPDGPPRPNGNTNTNSNANTNTNTNTNANQNANANANSNTNDNVNSNTPLPGSPIIAEFPDTTTLECTVFRSNQLTLIEGNAPVTWTIRNSPPGMTISSASRRITWNDPNFGYGGLYDVEVVATNSLGEDTETFRISVEPLFIRVLERVSNSLIGAVPDKESVNVAVSDDGARLVFQSDATNLVRGDTNLVVDVFLLDRAGAELRRLSLTDDGAELNVPCITPAISGDGEIVAYQTFSGALVPDDNNNNADIIILTLSSGTLEIASRASDGTLSNGGSSDPALSSDGRFVAYVSNADNLVTGDTNQAADVFVRDRQTFTTTRVSIATGGGEADGLSRNPAISADGRFVIFVSEATNLVSDDANGAADVFIHDRQTGATTRLVNTGGVEIPDGADSPSIGGGTGAFITFVSRSSLVATDANNAADVYLLNRTTGAVSLVSAAPNGFAGNGASTYARLSPDGSYCAFESAASDLVAGDPNNNLIDVFRRNLSTNATVLVSLNDDLESGNGASFRPTISRGGVFVAFESKADNMTCPDDFDFTDIFGKPLAP